MNDEQKARVAEALTSGVERLVAWIERAGGFAEEQAPIVAREIVNAGLVVEVSHVIEALGLAIATWMFSRWLMRQSLARGDGYLVGGRVALFCVAIILIIGYENIADVLEIVVAPRLYVLEQLRAML